MADPIIGRQLGDYVIQELLGRGGMARVFKGYDSSLMRYAAVKVITSDVYAQDQAEYAERFRREARAIARLNHPNIVQVYQYGEERDLYYMAMVFIEGKDLRQIIKEHTARGQVMQLDDVLNITQGIGAALDNAHSRGVIHRDVKPSNIMLDADNRPVLTDFGLALSTQEGTFGDTFGSAHYIAPEQAISSARAVPQSDLYSLGVCIYEMLTGYVPFDDPSAMTVAMKHLNEVPPSPRQYNPHLSPAVERVILRALEKDPKRRYDTGAQFAAVLAAAYDAPPETDLQRLLSATESHSRTASRPSSAFRTPIFKEIPTQHDNGDDWDSGGVAGGVEARKITRPSIAAREDARRIFSVQPKQAALLMGLAVIAVAVIGVLLGAINGSTRQTETPTSAVASLATNEQTSIAQVEFTATLAATDDEVSPTPSLTEQPIRTPLVISTSAATSASTADNTPTSLPPTITPTIPTSTPTNTRTATLTSTPSNTPTPLPPTWTPNPSRPANVEVLMLYNIDQVNLLNVSGRTLNISGLTFVQSGSDRRFDASDWNSEFSANTTADWPTFRCYQVFRVGTSADIEPFAGCDRIAAFRGVSAIRQFWVPSNSSINTFNVFAAGTMIASCQISAGRCELTLPR